MPLIIEEGRRKKEEGRRKKEEGRKREEGKKYNKVFTIIQRFSYQ
ncbi:MAG: hypothetical protein ACRC62_02965 [Microcoleus sp.]